MQNFSGMYPNQIIWMIKAHARAMAVTLAGVERCHLNLSHSASKQTITGQQEAIERLILTSPEQQSNNNKHCMRSKIVDEESSKFFSYRGIFSLLSFRHYVVRPSCVMLSLRASAWLTKNCGMDRDSCSGRSEASRFSVHLVVGVS